MDNIQKELIRLGHKDLAQEYHNKISVSNKSILQKQIKRDMPIKLRTIKKELRMLESSWKSNDYTDMGYSVKTMKDVILGIEKDLDVLK